MAVKRTASQAKAEGGGSGRSTSGKGRTASPAGKTGTGKAGSTSTAKKAAARKSATKKAATTKAATTRTATGKTTTKKTATGKATGKASTKKAATGKATTKKAATTRTGTKAAARKAAPQKSAATKTAPRKSSTATGRKSSAATKSAAARPGPVKVTAAAARGLPVLEGESPWTSAELVAVKDELETDVTKLQSEVDLAEVGLAGLMQDAGDQSGDDEADAGAKTFEREQEISLANNSRDLLDQSLHALRRIAEGTYGACESCGSPVGKLRLQAFPRATLCMTCKRKQERR